MATAKQIAGNRLNAKRSTGPKTDAGRATVSQNNFRHGLRGKFHIIPEIESHEEYDRLLNELLEDEQPAGRAEVELVIKMAEHTWLSKRALKMQDACFVPQPDTPENKKSDTAQIGIASDLERWVRYQASHNREYQRASKELQDRRKQRLKAEIGFERQQREQAAQMLKTEKQQIAIATAKIKKQLLEIKLGNQIADLLPPNFDPSTLDSVLSPAEGA